jgi:hypothetical protein
MTRLEKCELLKSKGYKYDPDTGKIYGIKGDEIKNKKDGYIFLKHNLKGHHFAWYMSYGKVNFIQLDHKNSVRDDNRISNLRILCRKGQMENIECKGYTWDKLQNKWMAKITHNYKTINLGRFNTEEEARQAYLSAKKIYHKI